jgi:hypothetical protein
VRIDGSSTVDRAAMAAVSSGVAPGIDFAATLQRHLAEPRATIANVRAAIDAIRDGAAIHGGIRGGGRASQSPVVGVGADTDLSALFPYGPSGPATDPFGWRALSRRVGDELVAPGFGTLFERQIARSPGSRRMLPSG